jgi:NAD(P)-dependent dehydrogenase (short-subunit alcohol dehydrogenase family)
VIESKAGPRVDLDGKVALVTGGTRGLGRQMVFDLARHGADVIVASRHADACQRVADEVRTLTGRQTLAHACHVGKWDEVASLVEASYERFGRVDVLINNAGMSPKYGSIVEVTEALWRKVVDVNLTGPFRLTALVGHRMVQAGGGSIINISSIASVQPSADYIPYAAAKAGLNAITMGFAQAFAPKVRVNAILCGPFLTDATKSWDTAFIEGRLSHTALRRIAEPEELFGTVLYFASEMSSFTTGALLRVDGGRM